MLPCDDNTIEMIFVELVNYIPSLIQLLLLDEIRGTPPNLVPHQFLSFDFLPLSLWDIRYHGQNAIERIVFNLRCSTYQNGQLSPIFLDKNGLEPIMLSP